MERARCEQVHVADERVDCSSPCFSDLAHVRIGKNRRLFAEPISIVVTKVEE